MKLLGHFLAFFLMTVIFMLIIAGLGLTFAAFASFVNWTLPSAAQLATVDWWLLVRLAFAVASIFGVWFACDKEGKDFANGFADEVKRGYE